MENKNEYWDKFNSVQNLIISLLNENPDLQPNKKDLKNRVKREFKKHFNEDLQDNIYRHAFNNLINRKEIEIKKYTIPHEKKSKEKGYPVLTQVKVVRITTKGVTKAIKKELIISAEEIKESMIEIKNDMNKRIDSNTSYMESIRTDVEEIKEDIEIIRKQFYGRILEIFGIFVTIFSLIIIGFTQVPNIVGIELGFWQNLSNVSAIFFPLLVVLLILMSITFLIVKKT